jgi:hypothetical protein
MQLNVFPRKRILSLLMLFMLALTIVLSGCSTSSAEGTHEFAMASKDVMPAEVQAAPTSVLQTYQFAVANPDLLKQVGCYCGCGPIGHTSNYACYVAEETYDAGLQFDAHTLGCSICVDITQDSMRLLGQGKSTTEIVAYIDHTYSQYGPSNIP